MIKIEKVDICGLEPAIRGMRNPMNSWDRSDSGIGCKNGTCEECNFKPEYCGNNIVYAAGPNDLDLMQRLANGGPVHAKYRRMITVYMDITAPLYWWKEFDTYKVGTVANSCSTMHKIHEKKFTLDDFSCEHLFNDDTEVTINALLPSGELKGVNSTQWLMHTCDILNGMRNAYLKTKDKKFWWQMIQLLPSSYNQKRTVMLNYEVLAGIYKHRRGHKLDEWCEFCKWIESLPMSEIITDYHVTKLVTANDDKDIVLSDGSVSVEEAAYEGKDDPIVKAVTDEANMSKSKPKLITEMTVAELFEDFENQLPGSLEEYMYKKLAEAANAKEEDEING